MRDSNKRKLIQHGMEKTGANTEENEKRSQEASEQC